LPECVTSLLSHVRKNWTMAVVRDAHWIEREYGREKWPAIESLVEEVAAREDDPFRLVSEVARRERYPDGPLEPVEAVFGGGKAEVPASVVRGGYQALIVDTALDHCSADTDLVVELGSGWGRNLFLAWFAGGPRSARYVAAEYTEAGRRVAARLGALAPGLDLASIPFDYHAPDLELVSTGRRALVFTAHSIEQIARLPDAVVDQIRGLADEVTCVHFEPVGWQFRERELEGSSERYAAEHDYSANLAPLLRRRAQAGELELLAAIPEAVGINPANATTVVVWRSL
jgi:hypothetical protein